MSLILKFLIEYGFTFKNPTDSKAICALLVGAMKEVAGEEQKRGKRICAMVIKDFYPNSLEIAEEFKLARFKTFQVDHNMVMPLLPEWQNLNDYLDSMNTKFRTKAKAALKRSDALEIIDRNEKNIQEIKRIGLLYPMADEFEVGINAKDFSDLKMRIEGFYIFINMRFHICNL